MTFAVHFKYVGLAWLVYASSETIYHHHDYHHQGSGSSLFCFDFIFAIWQFVFLHLQLSCLLCLYVTVAFAAYVFMRLPNAALGNCLPSPTFSSKEKKSAKLFNEIHKICKFVRLFYVFDFCFSFFIKKKHGK